MAISALAFMAVQLPVVLYHIKKSFQSSITNFALLLISTSIMHLPNYLHNTTQHNYL